MTSRSKEKKCDHVWHLVERRLLKTPHGGEYYITSRRCKRCKDGEIRVEEK